MKTRRYVTSRTGYYASQCDQNQPAGLVVFGHYQCGVREQVAIISRDGVITWTTPPIHTTSATPPAMAKDNEK